MSLFPYFSPAFFRLLSNGFLAKKKVEENLLQCNAATTSSTTTAWFPNDKFQTEASPLGFAHGGGLIIKWKLYGWKQEQVWRACNGHSWMVVEKPKAEEEKRRQHAYDDEDDNLGRIGRRTRRKVATKLITGSFYWCTLDNNQYYCWCCWWWWCENGVVMVGIEKERERGNKKD